MAEKVAKRYLVKTPNNDFKGKVAGIEFARGQAVVEELTLDPALGRSVEETARMLKDDFGYLVTEIK
ncbi:hypothetical protein CCP3SC15_450008 [Gammaproteobacteria bacterium]